MDDLSTRPRRIDHEPEQHAALQADPFSHRGVARLRLRDEHGLVKPEVLGRRGIDHLPTPTLFRAIHRVERAEHAVGRAALRAATGVVTWIERGLVEIDRG
jgi:hypothetical protein